MSGLQRTQTGRIGTKPEETALRKRQGAELTEYELVADCGNGIDPGTGQDMQGIIACEEQGVDRQCGGGNAENQPGVRIRHGPAPALAEVRTVGAQA